MVRSVRRQRELQREGRSAARAGFDLHLRVVRHGDVTADGHAEACAMGLRGFHGLFQDGFQHLGREPAAVVGDGKHDFARGSPDRNHDAGRTGFERVLN